MRDDRWLSFARSLNALIAEEFGIYLNYVRKLGFEETPDYDFLRELFSKVLKNIGDVDDGRYDWNELNGGRGWESQMVSCIYIVQSIIEPCALISIVPQLANASSSNVPADQRRRESERREGQDRRRLSQQQPGVAPPSPALVRNPSKQRKTPNALMPGTPTNMTGGITPPRSISIP